MCLIDDYDEPDDVTVYNDFESVTRIAIGDCRRCDVLELEDRHDKDVLVLLADGPGTEYVFTLYPLTWESYSRLHSTARSPIVR